METDSHIFIDDMPIITPNGDIIVQSLSLRVGTLLLHPSQFYASSGQWKWQSLMECCKEAMVQDNRFSGFPTRSDINRPLQYQKKG